VLVNGLDYGAQHALVRGARLSSAAPKRAPTGP
jgi:hypothetical protein